MSDRLAARIFAARDALVSEGDESHGLAHEVADIFRVLEKVEQALAEQAA